MRRLCRFALIVCIVAVQSSMTSSQVPTNSGTLGDYARIEEDHPNLGGWQHRDLHQQPVLQDGSKGYSVVLSSEGNLGHPLSSLGSFQDANEYSLHELGCESSAIVVGTLTGFEPILTQDKTTIVTRYHFKVDSKLTTSAAVEANIDVVQLGGEIVDNGEKLRVTVVGVPRYKVNTSYLLFLLHDDRASKNVFYTPALIRAQILSGRIAKLSGLYDPKYIRDGESLEAFKGRLQESLAKGTCK